jgi:cytochrome c oxidase subunit 2
VTRGERAEALLMGRLRNAAATAGLAVLATTIAVQARADEIMGQPVNGGIGLQPGASILKHEAISFHNYILLPIITVITLFVLALLLIVIFRFNSKANPTPAKWTHNTLIEVVWTGVPVLILMVIAIFLVQAALRLPRHSQAGPDDQGDRLSVVLGLRLP